MKKIFKTLSLALMACAALVACKDNNGEGSGPKSPYNADITTPANCYIVAPGSVTRFVANIGNTAEKAQFATAELTWQDAQGLITKVEGQAANGAVVVTTAAEAQGNALVSVKDADGKIVWNYHVWVTNYNPEANVMTFKATKTVEEVTYNYDFVMMDRYLGAMSGEVGSLDAFGLHYNWGRPTPLFAGTLKTGGDYAPFFDMEGDTVALTLAAPVENLDNNIPTAIANPTTQYNGGSDCNYGWLGSKAFSKTAEVDDLWGGVSGVQTKYDPCPAGWRVAPYNAYRFFDSAATAVEGYEYEVAKVYANDEVANANFLGMKVTTGDKSFFFPAAGESGPNGNWTNGYGGTWPNGKAWTAVNDTANSRAWATAMSPSSASCAQGLGYSYALPVRCIKL